MLVYIKASADEYNTVQLMEIGSCAEAMWSTNNLLLVVPQKEVALQCLSMPSWAFVLAQREACE